jgi:C4-dicarboxylate-specific signal transduction histidine kinase
MALLTSAVAHFAFTGLILDTSTRAQVQSVRERTASEHSARLETQMHLMDRQDRLALVSGAMTQELNQPLSTALTQLQTLRQTLGSNLAPPETWNTGLELARLQVRRASVMLDQIRSLARPHSGVRMDRLDLQEVVQATADLMRAEWRGQAIQVELVLQDQPLWCQGDEVALSHVLLNLLRNATQAVQGAPQRRLKVQTLATQHEVTVLVHDSGPGLPLEALARWGEPLRTTRKHPAGLAFELALSAPSSGSTRAG